MKTLNLESFGVQEMDAQLMVGVDGGYFLPSWFLKVNGHYQNVERFFSDFADGFNNEQVNKGYRQVTGKSL